MRLIDANALISDLEHDVERDMTVLDTLTLGRVSRESIQFDKDWKQNTIDLLMRVPTIEPESKWIPCTPETMPEEAETYLCTCADAGRLMVTLIKWQRRMKSWNLTGARTHWKVIAWMPLPAAYKPEEESE